MMIIKLVETCSQILLYTKIIVRIQVVVSMKYNNYFEKSNNMCSNDPN